MKKLSKVQVISLRDPTRPRPRSFFRSTVILTIALFAISHGFRTVLFVERLGQITKLAGSRSSHYQAWANKDYVKDTCL